MNTYFERYAYRITLFTDKPDASLKLAVVIPCFNEPDIISTLNSLNSCQKVEATEVIIIINESEAEQVEITEANRKTIEEIEEWKEKKNPWFKLLSYNLKIPNKDAGVGFARKAGMDEASRRFEQVGNVKGVICCFDADSTCSANYLSSVYHHYYQTELPPIGSSIYYEHLFPSEPILRSGIIQYELHLRYYANALQFIGYPYAHQTVGSSMVVRSDMYQKIGGMNKRKAGEDFYFLHRLMPAGYYTDITDTCIYPSPRISDRVPFGTGKAMEKWKMTDQEDYMSYNLSSFKNLKILFKSLEAIYRHGNISMIPIEDNVDQFLKKENFDKVLERILGQSKSLQQFKKQFYAYFDGFKVLKYIHFSRDHYYHNTPVLEAARALCQVKWHESKDHLSPEELLTYYRGKDRGLT